MKNNILQTIICFFLLSCSSQTKEFSLIGEWKEIEYRGSNGADVFVQKINKGRTFIFEKTNKVNIIKDGVVIHGDYQIKGDSLQISLPNEDNFFLLFHLENGNLAFNPMTEKYEIICDEGCAYIFKKIK
mgnify:FL=1